MKSWKKALTLALALLMLMACGVSAFAANPEVTMDPKVITGSTGNTASSFKGTIVATMLSVSVPSTVAFNIDPTMDANAANVSGQIEEPELTVINNSLVPVTLKINGCTIEGASTPKLVNDIDDLTDARAVMFAIKHTEPDDFATDADWLMDGSTGYNVLPANNAIAADGGTITIHIYGRTTTGWTAGNTFTVKPIFVVAPAATTDETVLNEIT